MSEVPKFKFAVRDDLVGSIPSFLPTKGEPHATGWDVKVAFPNKAPHIIRAGMYIKIPLGFRVLPPNGWWLEIRPRSSTFAKKQLHCLYGVIDESYEGECLFACQYLPDISSMASDITLQFGEAIGQIIPVKRQEMEIEEATNEQINAAYAARGAKRGTGGFGSTGR
jgi:dUTPase